MLNQYTGANRREMALFSQIFFTNLHASDRGAILADVFASLLRGLCLFHCLSSPPMVLVGEKFSLLDKTADLQISSPLPTRNSRCSPSYHHLNWILEIFGISVTNNTMEAFHNHP